MEQFMKNLDTKYLTQLGLLIGIITLLAVTPLGYIPVGVIRATTIHIPVIIGGILLGPRAGAVLGFYFGLTSLVNNTINPTVTSFVFTPFYQAGEIGGSPLSLIICFVPRILIGVTAAYLFRALSKIDRTKLMALGVSGVVGSLVNTFLVLGGIYLFFGKDYAAVRNIPYESLLGVIGTIISVNGVTEAIVAGIITVLAAKAILTATRSQ